MYDACLARDPIFDRNNALIGYKISFRNTKEGREALSLSLSNGTFEILRSNLPAFIACDKSQLLSDVFAAVDAKSLVLLLQRDVDEDPEVLSMLQKIRAAGGRLALDNLEEEPSPSEQLSRWAEFARIDLCQQEPAAVAAICKRLSNTKTRFIADQIADVDQHAAAMKMGFEAFEGPHFSRAEAAPANKMPAASVTAMRLLALARDPNVSDRALEEAVSSDPVLAFQLLRLVNSAAVGVKGVSSIGHALRIIGRNTFLRWLALAVAASRGAKSGIDQHCVRQAVVRGRLLEQFSGQGRDAGTLFLVGLFSLMDSVFRMPLHDIVARVALGDDAKAALLDRSGPYSKALSLAESYELGMFESALQVATEIGLNADKLPEFYATAVQWSAEALSAMVSKSPERNMAAR